MSDATTRSASPERSARLDSPFFVETETEIVSANAADKSKPEANSRKVLTASACVWFLAFCAALCTQHSSSAATLTWTGGSFLSANWSDSANWSPTGIPGNGDSLVFPSSPLLQQVSTNDLVGLTLNQLQFLGSGPSIVLGGNAFTLTNGIFVNYTFGGIYINNNITLASGDSVMYVTQSGYLGLGGTLSGSVGVIKTGVGILAYTAAGNNLYTGTTRVNGGGLLLNVNGEHAFQGPLVIGDGSGTNNAIVQLAQLLEIDGIAPVTVNLNATLDLNGFNEVLPALTIQGGTVKSGAGTLSMAGDVTVLGSSVTPTISGNLLFTGGHHIVNVAKGSAFPDLNLTANVSDQGGGLLFTNNAPSQTFVGITGTNQFTGPLTLDNLTLSAGNPSPSPLGATNSTTIVGGHGRLWLYSTGITNHSLTLADGAVLVGQDDCTWAGPITLNGNVTIDSYPAVAALALIGTISGPGGFTKVDVGSLELFGSSGNTYAGNTWIESGLCLLDKASGVAIPGGTLTISDHSGSNAVVRDINVGANLGSTLAVAINEQGILDLNGFVEVVSPITFSGGTLETGTGHLQIDGDIYVAASTNVATMSGAVLFAGGLRTITIDASWIYPNLAVPASVADTGSGFQVVLGAIAGGYNDLELEGSNSFTGPLIINDMFVAADTPWALGATSGGTFVTNSGILWLNQTAITNETLTLAAGTEFAGENNCIWTGPINLLGDASIFNPSGWGVTFDIQGPITGTGNLLIKGSAGIGATNRFSGPLANTYSGTTTVNFTTLVLAKTPVGGGIPNNLVVNNGTVVRLGNDWQIDSPTKSVSLGESSLFDLAGHNDWVGPVGMQGSQITSESGVLYLGGDLTVNSSTNAMSEIDGNASLWNGTRTINCVGHNYSPDVRILANLGGNSTSGLIKTGIGEASLAGANNTFPGPTTVNAGSLGVAANNALGNTNTPATVNNGGNLFLDGSVAVGLKPLSLAGAGGGQGALTAGFGTNSWAGNVTLASNAVIDIYTNDTLELSGVISGPGNLTKLDWGNLLLDGAISNNFSGTTLVQQGLMTLSKTNGPAIPGALTIGKGLDGPNGDVLRALQANQLSLSNTVTISSSGLLDITLASITRAGSIAGSGSIQMGSSMLMFGYDNTSNTFSGSISGTADLTKVGNGTWTYTGTGSYGGNFGVNSGQVFVDGSLASAAIFFYAGTTFGGGGSVGPITSGNGLLSVGDNNPGILNSGSLTLASGNTFLAYIAGTNAGTGYSQMSFSGGTISLGSAHLQLNMSVVGATNAHYTLIHNPTIHVISGTFNGLPEGATVTASNGVHFTITYHGGVPGNDVVLTQTTLPTPPSLTGITHLTNGNITITGTGAPNVTYHVQATTNLAPPNWVSLGPVTANNLGVLSFTDSQTSLYPARFYRFVYP
jgi:autotransporter-associated beta strand protein